MEHVLGWARFAGLRIAVGPGVFVPRRRSEFLVRVAADLLTARKASSPQEQLVAVDLCCGSGALGAALFARVGGLELHCADIDPVAVDYARRNLLGTGAQAYCGDLVEPLPPRLRDRVAVLVANVPYIPTSALRLLPGEARLHEPRAALAGGPDGLDVARRVAAAAPGWLAPGGHLLIETSRDQVPTAVAAFSAAGLVAEVNVDDELAATVIVGRYDRC